MPDATIETVAHTLMQLCIRHSMSPAVPHELLCKHKNPPWFTLSLIPVYISFAQYWLSLLSVPTQKWTAVARELDELFYGLLKATDFHLSLSDVLVFPAEQAAICDHWEMMPKTFLKATGTSNSVLGFLFASRCNQYRDDVKRGVIWAMEHPKRTVIGPTIFVYKRFLQHIYAFPCDPGSDELDNPPHPHWMFLEAMFGEALIATSQAVRQNLPALS